MRNPPLSVILSWPLPNYVDPTTRGPGLVIVNTIFIAFVTIAVIGRFYSRIFIKKWVGIDDALIVPAFIFAIGLCSVEILADIHFDWDRHVWDLAPNLIQGANEVAFAAKILFTLAATFTRLSIICFYYRLIRDSGITWFKWVLHASVALVLAVGIYFLAMAIWLCRPIRAYWVYPPISNGHCLNEGKVMLSGGVINSAIDLLTTVLPIPVVMRLQMPLKQRIEVCILLSLGGVVTIAGAIRTYFTWKGLMACWDETWWAYPLWIAGAVEIDLAVVCACAPAWKTLLQKPLLALSSKLSSKLSSLRSPNNSRNLSISAKSDVFNPLRSLPWFLHTRFDFEKTQRNSDKIELRDMEKGLGSPSELAEDDHRIELQHDAGARDFRHSDIVDESARPTARALHITMRTSIDRRSAHVEHHRVRTAQPTI